MRAIGAWQRRVVLARSTGAPKTGAITFVQRVGGPVRLSVHFHLVVPDIVFIDDGDWRAFTMQPVSTRMDFARQVSPLSYDRIVAHAACGTIGRIQISAQMGVGAGELRHEVGARARGP